MKMEEWEAGQAGLICGRSFATGLQRKNTADTPHVPLHAKAAPWKAPPVPTP